MIKGYYPIVGVNESINKLLRLLFSKAQAVQGKIRNTTPTIDSVDEKEICFYDDGTNMHLYIKLEGNLYYETLTKV